MNIGKGVARCQPRNDICIDSCGMLILAIINNRLYSIERRY